MFKQNYLALLPNPFQMRAANAAPINGPTINTHNWHKACPPNTKAGPKLRAGLTEVPVSGMPIMCTNVSVKPMTRPAIVAVFWLEVTPKMVSTKTQVKIASTSKAPQAVSPMEEAAPYPLAPNPVAAIPPKLVILIIAAKVKAAKSAPTH